MLRGEPETVQNPPMREVLDVELAVVGGGIIGLATADAWRSAGGSGAIAVLEKDAEVGTQQSGHNSGVVHAGLYYKPGSLKAELCTSGRTQLREFCAEHAIPYDQCGKVVVATDESELERLSAIMANAIANGVPDVRSIGRDALREIEPHVRGLAAVWSPQTAIVDFPAVCRVLAQQLVERGGEMRRSAEVVAIETADDGARLTARTSNGSLVVNCRTAVLCGGLHADLLAQMAGGSASPRIVPFRGEYYALRARARDLVRGLVYPVPDPRYPFLGIHLTKRIDGEVLVGPNAVLALARQGYRWRDVDVSELVDLARFAGFRRLARAHWRTGAVELRRSLSRKAFVAEAQRFVPAIEPDSVVRSHAGVRAQAVDSSGALVDDFALERLGSVLAVRNAPSPAATSAFAIARHLVELGAS